MERKRRIKITCPACEKTYDRADITKYNFSKSKGLFMCTCGKCCIRGINLIIDEIDNGTQY